jgi:hypothetical protein
MDMEFEALTAMAVKSFVVWDITPRIVRLKLTDVSE